MRTRLTLLACFFGAGLGAESCLRVDQSVRGVPGMEPDRAVIQRLWIAEDKARVDEAAGGPDAWAPRYLLRTDRDPAAIYELMPATKTYRQWEELENLQRDRAVNECQILDGIMKLPAAERAKALAAQYLREDLTRVVEVVSEPAAQRTVGGRPFECRRVRIIENGLTVLDAQVTDQIGRGLDYCRLYRQLGAFSDEVLAKAGEIKGFPLAATIAVVTQRLTTYHTLKIEVTDLAEADVAPSFFELPEGWTKEEKALREPCRWRLCDKTVETANPGERWDYKGRRHYFCSPKCKAEFLKELKAVLARGGRAEELLEGRRPGAGPTAR